LDFVLELYRLAQETPVTEFHDLALNLLTAIVKFRAATWSDAAITSKGVEIFSVRLHKEPTEVRSQFSALNRKHARRLLLAVNRPGQASVLNNAAAYFNAHDEAPMRAYLKRYGHERNLLITDLRQWLSLYRVSGDEPFAARDIALINLLMPHLVEALHINRALAVGEQLGEKSPARALIDRNGVFLYCGERFCEMLRQEWHDWWEPRIPDSLLASLQRSRSAQIAAGTIEMIAQRFGDAVLLTARPVSLLERLSQRELMIAREFAVGKSYKTIARDLHLAPATVRNVLQRTYRKLEIDNKAALARLVELERVDGHRWEATHE
jgi:DNA-binding CsgD family transcriptional regulator